MINYQQKNSAWSFLRDVALFFVRLTFILGILAILRMHMVDYSLTLESLVLITCSEVNIWKEWARRYRNNSPQSDPDIEKQADTHLRSTECVGSVVGYREDPGIYSNCLKSYVENCDYCMRVLVLGVDGNQAEDLSMIEVAEKVFGDDLVKIELPRTFGSLAKDLLDQQQREPSQIPTDHGRILGELITQASSILQEHGVLYPGSDKLVPICLNQPHHSKKEIMFTNFIFCLALCRNRNIPFIWSSDSDSWIFPGTLGRAISGIAGDESFGGSCTQMEIHNSNAAFISYIVAATYWSEIHLTSGLLSAFGAIDCLPGPCALFRYEALEEILLDWYDQQVFGIRPTINEDRHLTTRLLLSGWKISFSAQAIVATDAPTTLAGYTRQQLRWSRATIMESLYYPLVYFRHSPVLFLASLRRLIVPIVCMCTVCNYLYNGGEGSTDFVVVRDILFRILLCASYTVIRHKGKLTWFAIQLIAQPVWFILRAGYSLWSFVTVFDNNWGSFRNVGMLGSNAESKKTVDFLSGSQLASSVWLGLVAAAMCKYVARAFLMQSEYYITMLGFIGTSLAIASIYYTEDTALEGDMSNE